MYYLLISFISFGFILYIENKRCNVNNNCSFIGSIKSCFDVKKFFLLPFVFVFSVFVCYLLLLKLNIMSFGVTKNVYIPYILYSVVSVPIIEEYFYRFLPFQFIRKKNIISIIAITMLSSLLFTFFHNLKGIEYVFIFIMAVLLCVIYLKNRNISYNIMCHSLYNLVINIFYLSNYIFGCVVLIVFGMLGIFVILIKKRKKV